MIKFDISHHHKIILDILRSTFIDIKIEIPFDPIGVDNNPLEAIKTQNIKKFVCYVSLCSLLSVHMNSELSKEHITKHVFKIFIFVDLLNSTLLIWERVVPPKNREITI